MHHLIDNFAYLPEVKTHLAGRGPLLSLLYIISPFLTPPYTCLSYTNTVSSTILYSYSHSAGFKALMGATNHQETKVGINCWFFFSRMVWILIIMMIAVTIATEGYWRNINGKHLQTLHQGHKGDKEEEAPVQMSSCKEGGTTTTILIHHLVSPCGNEGK